MQIRLMSERPKDGNPFRASCFAAVLFEGRPAPIFGQAAVPATSARIARSVFVSAAVLIAASRTH
jgi:hypothetical protein